MAEHPYERLSVRKSCQTSFRGLFFILDWLAYAHSVAFGYSQIFSNIQEVATWQSVPDRYLGYGEAAMHRCQALNSFLSSCSTSIRSRSFPFRGTIEMQKVAIQQSMPAQYRTYENTTKHHIQTWSSTQGSRRTFRSRVVVLKSLDLRIDQGAGKNTYRPGAVFNVRGHYQALHSSIISA